MTRQQLAASAPLLVLLQEFAPLSCKEHWCDKEGIPGWGTANCICSGCVAYTRYVALTDKSVHKETPS